MGQVERGAEQFGGETRRSTQQTADQGVGRTANCKGGNPLEAEQEVDGEDWNSLEAGGGGKTPLEAWQGLSPAVKQHNRKPGTGLPG